MRRPPPACSLGQPALGATGMQLDLPERGDDAADDLQGQRKEVVDAFVVDLEVGAAEEVFVRGGSSCRRRRFS